MISKQSTTSAKTTEMLRSVFARNGLPEILVSDNGPQFTSEEFDQFTKTNGIKRLRSARYHPATNGLAERFVQTFKQSLRAMKWEASSIERKLAYFLMAYRNAPHATIIETPAKVVLRKKSSYSTRCTDTGLTPGHGCETDVISKSSNRSTS